jgi:hypothetical protein
VIRRFGALLGKELRQHLLAGIVLALLLGLGLFAVLLMCATGGSTVSMLEAHLFFMWVFAPLGAAVLGNRLVVSEWYGRTQLFVESLPLRRGEMLLVKYVLGLSLLTLCVLGSLGLTCAVALRHEPVDAHFFAILAARTLVFTWALWSFLFAMGLLGRFRIPIYLGIGLGLIALGTLTEVDVRHFGPFALVDHATLPFERTDFPVLALEITAGLSLGWMALAFFLATVREGSIAEGLSRRMSPKEKVAIAVIFIAAIPVIEHLEKRREKKPYTFGDSPVVLRKGSIEVLYLTEDVKVDAATLLDRLATNLDQLRDELGWEALPPVRIAHRRELDARTIETAYLAKEEGVLLRANLKRVDAPTLEALVVHHVISKVTKDRAMVERRHWVLDGFSRWWIQRLRPRGIAWSRALWATRERPVSLAWLVPWERTEEELGDPIAGGVAYSGIRVLEEERGREAVIALARALYSRRAHGDFRDVLLERAHPLESVFREATGLELADFLERWNAALARGREDERALLETVPRGTGSIVLARGRGDIRSFVYRYEFTRPPVAGAPCTLLHVKLGPFDWPLQPSSLLRVDHPWREGALTEKFELAGKYGRGERAFLALEVEADALAAPIRLHAERAEVP